MYCPNCKNQIADTASFCTYCGTAVAQAPAAAGTGAPQAQPPTRAQTGMQPQMPAGIPAPGFSERLTDPEILAAMQRNSRAAGIFGVVLIPLPLIGFLIYSKVTGKMEFSEALKIGAIVSGVFLLFTLISLVKRKTAKSYDAVVTDKRTRTTYRHTNSDDKEMITEYTVVARTDDGKTRKIVEYEGSPLQAYEYLNIGDRFRYHPQFVFPYEHYDKSKAPYLCCVSCGKKNPVTADRCQKCNVPLLK